MHLVRRCKSGAASTDGGVMSASGRNAQCVPSVRSSHCRTALTPRSIGVKHACTRHALVAGGLGHPSPSARWRTWIQSLSGFAAIVMQYPENGSAVQRFFASRLLSTQVCIRAEVSSICLQMDGALCAQASVYADLIRSLFASSLSVYPVFVPRTRRCAYTMAFSLASFKNRALIDRGVSLVVHMQFCAVCVTDFLA